MMTLVDDDVPVAGEYFGDVLAAGERGQHDDVDDAGELGAATAQLAGLDAEVRADAVTPLVGQRLAVHEHGRRRRPLGDQRARHDGLPRAWRCDQDTVVVGQHGSHGVRLFVTQLGAQGDVDLGARGTQVGELQS
jgi:hypothetical protein